MLLGTVSTGIKTSCRELHFYLIMSAIHATYVPFVTDIHRLSILFLRQEFIISLRISVFFYRHTFLIYMVSFFFPSRLYLYSFKLSCLFISNIPSSYAYQLLLSPKANSRRRGMSLTELTPFSLTYVSSLFFSLLSPFY